MRGKLEIFASEDGEIVAWSSYPNGLRFETTGEGIEHVIREHAKWVGMFGHTLPIEQVA